MKVFILQCKVLWWFFQGHLLSAGRKRPFFSTAPTHLGTIWRSGQEILGRQEPAMMRACGVSRWKHVHL